ncbi:MAG TPA: gluconate 2-dehydrogenase subunit 3 family protein [Candidatus Angelobacter sp.]|nr:gluconate 2-dehydrogenase subunit 3 family protein [Candidatus Angelobacter sp.]
MLPNTDNALPVIQRENGAVARVTRRQLVQKLLAGLSFGAFWPLSSPSHPIYEHFRNQAVLNEADKLGADNWRPVFLNAQQNETLLALAESIVPGSSKAQVNRFIDLLLSVDKPENQHQFVSSLAAFDAESQTRYGKDFPALDGNQKNALLTDASQAPANTDSPPTNSREENSSLYQHFENLKGWVSGAYYSSEVGMRELGWNGDYAFETFPGCDHPEGHH